MNTVIIHSKMESFSVPLWLGSIGCSEFLDTFFRNGITSKETVSSLTEQQLREWGIDTSRFSDGKRILEYAPRLRDQTEEAAVQVCLVSSMYTS